MTKHKLRIDWVLVCISVLSAILNVYGIWKDQYVNAYYTSAVKSMMQSFHNFFFASFDPGGFVTVDKPPVTFWVQTLFAKLFGLHGWSVILPQALAAIGSVGIVYILVKPSFGKTAARLASLMMAVTPIAVAVSRTNNVDSILVFTLLVATWMLFRAVRLKKWGWVLGSFAMIGVGFNEKMLEAYMVLPAFYVFYLLAFRVNWKKKLSILAGATVLMLAISFSWSLAVDLTPQSARPYVGSSQTNSEFELAFGYNGVSRLTGNGGPGGSGTHGKQGDRTFEGNGSIPNGTPPAMNGNTMPPQMSNVSGGNAKNWRNHDGNGPMRMRPGGGNGMFNTGQAGPLRLFQEALSGQASWILPFALFGTLGLLAGVRRGKKLTSKQQETMFWFMWLLPVAGFFSIAGFFHQYYLIMLAPPIAALAGTGWVALWQEYREEKGWRSWLLPVSGAVTSGFQLYVLQPYTSEIGYGWSIGIGALGLLTTLVLVLMRSKQKLTYTAAVTGILALLIAPLYWAATPMLYGGNSQIPSAGPELNTSRQNGGMPNGMFGGKGTEDGNINTKLLSYLDQHNTGETFLFATTSSNTAAPYIIQTGKAVMAMGGFSGSDPILTVSKLKELIANKEVKYFLIPSGSGGFGGPGGGSDSTVLEWIRSNGKQVPTSEWQASTSNSSGRDRGMGGSMALYEVQ